MRPRILLLRGDSLNPWEWQNFAPLLSRFDIQPICSRRNLFPLPKEVKPFIRPCWEDLLRSLPGGERWAGVYRRLTGEHCRLWGVERLFRKAHLIHTADTLYSYTEQAVRARLGGGPPVVLTCWENIPFAHEQHPRLRRRKMLVRQKADFFLPVTEKAALALEWEGVERSRMEVLTPGIAVERFAPSPEQRFRERQSQGWGEEVWVVLFVGRMVWEKGVWDLLQAARRLKERRFAQGNWRLVWVGEGPERRLLQEVAKRWGLEGICQWLGAMPYERMPSLYAAADLFVLPSLPLPRWEEQLGMVLLEAMAAGLPILATPCGSIPEVVGEAAILAPLHDPEGLAEAIERLAREAELRRHLARKGQDRAREHFDRRRFAERLGGIYERLLAA